MGDSDDENFVTFGNALEPLDEENLPRKKAVTLEDQYALDAQGRRRFHGAFTGGFSAGYFNSVGTRDGWRPQRFKSSRSSKSSGISQRPEDFMDEEDTGEFGIAPTAIRAHSDFVDHGARGNKRERQHRDNDAPIPGVPVLKELLKPAKDTVGVILLKKMGWRPGQGIGPRQTHREKVKMREKNEKAKIYGCSLPGEKPSQKDSISDDSDNENESILFAPDDYEPFRCNPKSNSFGIGYEGLDRRPVLSGHVNLFETSSFNLQEKNKKLSIRGKAFGVGAFEVDDDDIYEKDDMSRYDFSLGPEKSKTKSRWRKESESNDCLEGFTPAKQKLSEKKIFPMPDLPKNFEPIHVPRKSRFFPPIEFKSTRLKDNDRKRGLRRHDLNSEDRSIIIGDCRESRDRKIEDKTVGDSQVSKNTDSTVSGDFFAGKVGSSCEKSKVGDGKVTMEIVNTLDSTDRVSGESKMEERSLGESQSLNSDDRNVSGDVSREKVGSTVDTMSGDKRNVQTAINIINRSLNLHGKQQTNERKLGDSRNSSSDADWLEKLKSTNFVKGGVEGRDLGTPGSLKKLEDFKLAEVGNFLGEFSKPFAADVEKQKRFDIFLETMKNGEKDKFESVQPLFMTEWERQEEKSEFEQAARIIESSKNLRNFADETAKNSRSFVENLKNDEISSSSSFVNDKFVGVGAEEPAQSAAHAQEDEMKKAAKMKLFGKLTRQREIWQPASIVCKRFNIPEPRSGFAKTENQQKNKKTSVFDSLDFGGNSERFERATVSAGSYKEPEIPYKSRGHSGDLGEKCNSVSARVFDVSDVDASSSKSTGKIRSFEASYEKVFGRGSSIGNFTSAMKNVDEINLAAEARESSNSLNISRETRDDRHLGENSDAGGDSGSLEVMEHSVDKKDLFKAIFLSSSEDSGSENDEDEDSETVKSLLIGKAASELNAQRNNSPPRGIFAKLDLDSLAKPGKVREVPEKLGNFVSEDKDLGKSMEDEQMAGNCDEVGISKIDDSHATEDDILPDMYGPVLPTKFVKTAEILDNEEPSCSKDSVTSKPIFKSVVSTTVDSTNYDKIKGKWVERKSKKKKKEKHKHKHKEREKSRSRHKHKSKKDKR